MSEDQPLFTVVTVCWNDLDGLQATGESLRSQSLTDFEWVVIDGGSSDGTREWLEAEAGVARWVSEPDSGIYDAMNKGIDRAAGRYLLFLNSGDRLADPSVLADVGVAIAGTGAALVYGDAIDRAPDGRRYYREARSAAWLWLGMPTQHQSMFFKRDPDLRYDTSFELSGDYALVAAIVKGGGEVVRLDRPISLYALGGRSTLDRKTGIREDRRVRHHILGIPWLLVWAIELAQRVHHLIRSAAPRVFYRIRYRGGADR